MTGKGISLPISGQSFSVLLLKVTLVLAIAWLVHRILAGHNPRWRVLLWRGVICGVLLVPLITVLVPAFEVQIPRDVAFNKPISVSELPKLSPTTVPETPDLISGPNPSVESESKPVAPIAIPQSRLDPMKWLNRYIWVWILGIWGLGALGFSIRMGRGSRWIRGILKNTSPTSGRARNILRRVARDLGYSHKIELRYSSSITTPLLCGLWRPVILLPERMKRSRYEKRLPGILAHEVAHLCSRDLWWFAAIQWVSALLWFHPLMWRIRSVHAAACEELSDSVAAQYVGDAASYSQTLAQVALEFVGKPQLVGGIPMARSSKIRMRLKSLENPLNRLPLARRRIALSIFLGCVALLSVAALQAIPTGPLFPLHGPSGEIVLGTGSLRNAVFSQDGQRVLTVGSAGMYLWDFDTGDFIRAFLFRDPCELGTLAFSPDGSKILSIQDVWNSGPATVWDAGTGKGLFTTLDWFVSGAFSPDGGELALVGSLGDVYLLDAETGEEIWSYQLQKGTYQPGCAAFSLNRDQMVITGSAGTIVCDPASGGILFTYAQAIGSRVAVSHDGAQFLTGGTYETEWIAALWDIETGDQVGVFELDQPVDPPKGLSFSPDDMEILILVNPFRLDVWDMETREVRHIETGIYDEARRAIARFYSAEFSPDGAAILVARARSDGSRNSAILLDAVNGNRLRTLTDHIQVTTLAFSHNGDEVLTASNADSVNVWKTETGEILRTYDNFDVSGFRSVAFSPDGTKILAGGSPATLFDLETGTALQTFGDGNRIGFSPDGRRVFIGKTQGEIGGLWDAENGAMRHALSTGPVESIKFSTNGRKLLTSGLGIAKLWDAETGAELRTFGAASSPIECVAISPHGTKVVTARKNTATLWDVATGQELRTFQHRGRFPKSPIGFAAFSPDGMNIVTVCEDTAKLWDTATGQELGSFRHSDASIGHPINSVTFSPDGMNLVTAGDEITSKLWDIATGAELRTFSPAESSVIFSPDGTIVATLGKDKTARIWDISDLIDGTGIKYFAMY